MLEISLIEWPAEGGGPRFLGDLGDSDLVEQVQERLAAKYRRRLARVLGPAHLVPSLQASDQTVPSLAALHQEPGEETDGVRGCDP